MSVFNVEETLKHNKSPREIEKIAKLFGYSPADIDKIAQQWHAIHLSKWNEILKKSVECESVVKIKLRNRMSLQTLNSSLYIRYGLKLSGEACYEHQLPDDVL